MTKISINDLPKIKNELVGYKLISITENEVKFTNGQDEKLYILQDYNTSNVELYMPNYNNSILSIDASIKKYYGISSEYKTHKELDEILALKKYKHIAIMLLDGMGSYIIKDNMDEESFITTHKVSDLTAVYPPTTACAIPALCSGVEPIKTGWVGWSNYFKEVDKFVVMFRNIEYFTGESLNINIEKDILPYKKFYEDFNTHVFELGPEFTESKCKTFNEMCERYIEEIKQHESSFCYMYWDDPDKTIHINGSYSNETKNMLKMIDIELSLMNEKLPEDTLIIITADHGLIDVKPIYLANFKDILSLLERVPSNEGRCAFFKVKAFKKRKFEKLFNEYFSKFFTLFKRKDFLSEGYLGEAVDEVNSKLISFIGDYVAVAKSNYYFHFNPSVYSEDDDEMIFKAHHAGITANEMVIPFVIMKK